MLRARLISGLPADLVGSLTGLTQGHFPVHARARYADDLAERDLRRLGRKVRREHNAAKIVDSNDRRRSINIYSRRGAPVIAVNDGVVRKIGKSRKLGRFIVLQDVYGNRYTYAHLGKVSKRYPVPKTFDDPRARDEFRYARAAAARTTCPSPTAPASAGTQTRAGDAEPRRLPAGSRRRLGHRHRSRRPTPPRRSACSPTRRARPTARSPRRPGSCSTRPASRCSRSTSRRPCG